MSLILDALNRARQDADPVPGLATQHAPLEQRADWRRLLPWAGLALALAVIAWLLLGRGSPEPPTVENPVGELSRNVGSALGSVKQQLDERAAAGRAAAEAATAGAPPAPSTQAAAAATGGAPAAALAQGQAPVSPVSAPPASAPAVSASTDSAIQAPPPAVQPGAPVAAPTAATRTAPARKAEDEAAIAALYEQRAAEPEPAPRPKKQARETPIDLERVVKQAEEELANSRTEDHGVPFLSSLSQQFKDSVPTIYYQRHDYQGASGRSSVVLNGKPAQAGSSPVPGLRVEEILPDSLVLDFRGTRFRLRALNSWVNL